MWPFGRREPREMTFGRVKMPLVRKTRWSRSYYNAEKRRGHVDSRLADGSASITPDELAREWTGWSDHEKLDFCQALAFARVPEQKKMLRFLIEHGDHHTWSTVALPVALELPQDESFPTIREWCYSCKIGRGANYFQALAFTKSPYALPVLQKCFERICSHDWLMKDDDFCNWVAYDAICCMQYMLELGEDASNLAPVYARLKEHPCKSNRQQTRRQLSEYFESDTGSKF